MIAKTTLCAEIHVQCNYKYTCDIRWVLSSALNLVLLWQDLSLVGRWFQSLGAVTEKDLSPQVRFEDVKSCCILLPSAKKKKKHCSSWWILLHWAGCLWNACRPWEVWINVTILYLYICHTETNGRSMIINEWVTSPNKYFVSLYTETESYRAGGQSPQRCLLWHCLNLTCVGRLKLGTKLPWTTIMTSAKVPISKYHFY